jgi:hypothetical protein
MGLSYDPEDTAAARRSAVMKWKERIKGIEPPAAAAVKPEPSQPQPPKPAGQEKPAAKPPASSGGTVSEILIQ